MSRNGLIITVAAACLLGPLTAAASVCDAPSEWMVRVGAHLIDPRSNGGTLAVGKAEVKNKVGPTFNLDYHFCQYFTVDLLAALPYTHDIEINGTKVGTTQHLPPTLTLQFHPLKSGPLDPYVGIGVNRTFFFRNRLNDGTDFELKNTWGYAAQAGLDYRFGKSWVAGFDVRYIDLESKASVNGGIPIGTVKLDPFAYGVSIGYRF
ncbi:MAG: outer membrane beta-barrel protein [Nevskia sp.]|jgi:outer membrane protein|nr:outer membrane beta-barrel protein [Nevskia sp.]MCK9383632.1 outer membrane beta-barrel protein [Nevskia sp.]